MDITNVMSNWFLDRLQSISAITNGKSDMTRYETSELTSKVGKLEIICYSISSWRFQDENENENGLAFCATWRLNNASWHHFATDSSEQADHRINPCLVFSSLVLKHIIQGVVQIYSVIRKCSQLLNLSGLADRFQEFKLEVTVTCDVSGEYFRCFFINFTMFCLIHLILVRVTVDAEQECWTWGENTPASPTQGQQSTTGHHTIVHTSV